MLNPNWSRWIQQSLIIYFRDALDPTYLHVEGRQLPDPDPAPRFELLISDLNFIDLQGCWIIEVLINILVLSFRDDQDVYAHDRLAGTCASAMGAAISIYQYGDGDSYLGCFKIKPGQEVSVERFQPVEPVNDLLISSVNSSYEMILDK